MTLKESIARDLKDLPMPKLVEVATHAYRLNLDTQKKRQEMLMETCGFLSKEDGEIFEDSIMGDRERGLKRGDF